MPKRLTVVLERPLDGEAGGNLSVESLGRAVEAHPALEPLLDFAGADPLQIAAQIGVAYAYDPDDLTELTEIDFGPVEWHEPPAGLTCVAQALDALRADPGSVAAAVYAPDLRPAAVLADLEALERVLLLAQRHETRFRLILTG